MERLILIVILAAAVAILARIIWRSVVASATGSRSSCVGCPFDSKCGMQDGERLNRCEDGEIEGGAEGDDC